MIFFFVLIEKTNKFLLLGIPQKDTLFLPLFYSFIVLFLRFILFVWFVLLFQVVQYQ